MKLIVWTSCDKQKLIDEVLNPYVRGKHKMDVVVKIFKPGVLVEPDKNTVVMALGSEILATLKEASILPKNRAIGSTRGKYVGHNGGYYVVSYDPAIRLSDYEKFIHLQVDLNQVFRFASTGEKYPNVGQYRRVPTFADAIDNIKAMVSAKGGPVPVSFDLETVGLNPWDPSKYIVSAQLTYKAGFADVLYLNPKSGKLSKLQAAQIDYLLNSQDILIQGANFKYDLIWIFLKWGIRCTNFTYDTYLGGSLLDENRPNNLNIHAKLYTEIGGYDDEFNEKYDKGRMDLVPVEDVVRYGGGDTDACYRTANGQKSELKHFPRLKNFYLKLLHPAARAFERMELTGICVDHEYYGQLRSDLQTAKAKAERQALGMLPSKIKRRHSDNLKVSRSAIIKEYLFGPDGLGLKPMMYTEKSYEKPGPPDWRDASTAGNHLSMFKDNPKAKDFLEFYTSYQEVSKTLSTYVDGFLRHLREDGRYHPTYFLFQGGDEGGTLTGRTSAKNPAVQTIPKHTKWAKKLRRAFIAPPGYKILSVDFSEGELRIIACRAEEPAMLEAYAKGQSLHAKTAAEVGLDIAVEEFLKWKKSDPDEYDLWRFRSKAGNFGLAYGMGAPGFQTYARDSFGIDYTLEVATAMRDKHFEVYSGLLEWHKSERMFAKLHGYVVSPLGRYRHLPMIHSGNSMLRSKAERQAINSPIQSCLTDMLYLVMSLICENYRKEVDDGTLSLCLMVHDSLNLYVPENEAEVWAGRITELMENLPLQRLFGWTPQIPFTADAEVGYNMSEMVKLG